MLGASDQGGSLQRTLFRDIRDNLALLADAIDRSDGEQVYLRLRDLDGSLRELAANARDFHAAVAQLRREHDADPARFLVYKDLLIDYLEQFLDHLMTQRGLVARGVEAVNHRGGGRPGGLGAAGGAVRGTRAHQTAGAAGGSAAPGAREPTGPTRPAGPGQRLIHRSTRSPVSNKPAESSPAAASSPSRATPRWFTASTPRATRPRWVIRWSRNCSR